MSKRTCGEEPCREAADDCCEALADFAVKASADGPRVRKCSRMIRVVWIAFLLAIAMATFGTVRTAPAQSGEHDDGHGENHDQYRYWIRPFSGLPCCNTMPDGTGDCRPTKSFMGDDGIWRAWVGLSWIRIPESAVLPPDLLMDGRAHLCERAGSIFCFSPSQPKM